LCLYVRAPENRGRPSIETSEMGSAELCRNYGVVEKHAVVDKYKFAEKCEILEKYEIVESNSRQIVHSRGKVGSRRELSHSCATLLFNTNFICSASHCTSTNCIRPRTPTSVVISSILFQAANHLAPHHIPDHKIPKISIHVHVCLSPTIPSNKTPYNPAWGFPLTYACTPSPC
jgi:hypothetical protein